MSTLNNVCLVEDFIDGEGYLVDLGQHGAEIVVKRSSSAARKRYTIAHELGHWLLRLHGHPLTEQRVAQNRTLVEKWCDKFAAHLLMPREWVKADLRKRRLGGLVEAILEGPHRYQVSRQAFRLRVTEETPIMVAELVGSNNDGFAVRKVYAPAGSEEAALKRAIRLEVERIKAGGRPEWKADPRTRLISIHRRLGMVDGQVKWLVCALPQPRNSGTLEGQ